MNESRTLLHQTLPLDSWRQDLTMQMIRLANHPILCRLDLGRHVNSYDAHENPSLHWLVLNRPKHHDPPT